LTLSQEHGLDPTVFYRWQQTLFETGTAAFEGGSDPREERLNRVVKVFPTRPACKGEASGEIMAEPLAPRRSRLLCRTGCL
jgi:hypothetical protein